jgi:hypothetical protein
MTGAGQNMKLTFSGSVGQKVALFTQVSNDFTGCLAYGVTIRSRNGSQIYSDSNCNNASLWSDLLTLPVSDTYTIELDPFRAFVGSATFTLYNVPPDVTATVVPGAGAVSLATTVPGQNMRLTFNGAAGQRVNLLTQVSGFTGCVSYGVTILPPDGTTKLFDSSTCTTGSIISGVLTLPVAGSYTILLNPFNLNVGSATFTLYDVPPDATATITPGGSVVSATTIAPGQAMRLTFNATASQRVSLLTQVSSSFSDCLSYGVKILQPDGATQVYGDNGCGNGQLYSGLLTLPVAGSYTIVLTPFNLNVGTGTFTLYNVPPDATATITPGGSPVSATTTAPSQAMRVSFNGTAGERVSLLAQVSGTFNGGNSYGVTILQPNGTTQIYNSNGSFNGSVYTDVLILPVAGSYTIVLTPFNLNVGTGTFTLYDLPPDASATITPGGGTVSLTTTAPGQNMSLAFNGTAGERVSLLTQVSGTFNGANSYGVTILQPNGTTQIYNSNGSFNGSVYTDVLTLPVAGSYTIRLDPFNQNLGTATFTLYDVPPDATGTTTIGQAAANYDATVPGQAIRVSFAAQASQSVKVNVGRVSSTPSNACYNITTLQPNGTTVVRGDQSCGATYASTALTLPLAGTYTVVVKPTSTSIGTFSVGVATP